MNDQPDLEKLLSEQALQDWNDLVRIRVRLALLDRLWKDVRRIDAKRAEERQSLLLQYQEIKSRQSKSDHRQVMLGRAGRIFGPRTCGGCLTRPFAVANWRTLPPGKPGTSGTIQTTVLDQQLGLIEFQAELVNTGDPGTNDASVWLQQWVYLYTFPAPSVASTLHYEFGLMTDVSWFTQTNDRQVVIMLHLGIEHVHKLGSVGGPITADYWPAYIDTDLPEWGPYGFPSPITYSLTGSFDVEAGDTPALALFPGVFVIVPNGLVDLPDGVFWASNEFPADTTDTGRWGWITYCMEPIPVLESDVRE